MTRRIPAANPSTRISPPISGTNGRSGLCISLPTMPRRLKAGIARRKVTKATENDTANTESASDIDAIVKWNTSLQPFGYRHRIECRAFVTTIPSVFYANSNLAHSLQLMAGSSRRVVDGSLPFPGIDESIRHFAYRHTFVLQFYEFALAYPTLLQESFKQGYRFIV